VGADASTVAVAGQFNNWNQKPLYPEGNGYWSADVAGAVSWQTYKFVVNGSNFKKDPYSRKVESSSGNSIIYQTGAMPAGITVPWYEDMIIYELHVGSFGGSASGGPGDLASIASKAQYFKDIGVNMVELMPISEFPGGDSWGYDTSDLFAVESSYGGPEGLKTLVNALHNKGIGIILDVVYNHFGPNDLDLWQFDGWSHNNGGGIYFYNDWRGRTEWGNTRPDYGRGEVRRFIRDNAVYWLQEYNVDGLRWDSTVNIRKVNYTTDIPDGWSLMQWINNELDATKPSAISIADDMKKDPWLTYTTGSGGAGFDSQWDAAFVHAVKKAIEAAWDNERNMNDVAAAIGVHYGDRCRQVIYVSSHDEVGDGEQRPPSAIDPGNPGSWFAKKRATLGAAVLMTSPGIPMIFQGEEFLQPGYFGRNAADNYLDWDLVSGNSGILQMYRDLIAIRKNHASLRGNNVEVFHVDNNNKLIAFRRWNANQNTVVIVNFGSSTWSGNYQIGWPVWKTGHCIFNGDWNGYSSDFGNHGGWDVQPVSGGMDGMDQRANISIAPYTAVIYDLY
jgi:1,4-alpha-glucan branching enzyme